MTFNESAYSPSVKSNLKINIKNKNIYFVCFLLKEEENPKKKKIKMLMKKARVSKLLDRLHVSVVTACIGLTVASTAYLGYYGFWYLTIYRPLKDKEQEALLDVGAHDKGTAKSTAS